MNRQAPLKQFVTIDGVDLAYIEFAGKGPDALLLHGLSSHSLAWQAWLRITTLRFQAVALDFRGHGDSGDGDGYCPEHLAEEASGLWAMTGRPPAVVIGASYGGNAALVLAAYHPDLVRAVILIDPAVQVPRGAREMMRAQFLSNVDYPNWSAARAAWPLLNPGLPSDLLEAYYFENLTEDETTGRIRWKWRAEALLAAERCLQHDLTDLARRVTAPTLIVQAGERFVFPDPAAQALQAAIPDSQLTTIEGAGHVAHMTHPAEFDATVRSFLNEHNIEMPSR